MLSEHVREGAALGVAHAARAARGGRVGLAMPEPRDDEVAEGVLGGVRERAREDRARVLERGGPHPDGVAPRRGAPPRVHRPARQRAGDGRVPGLAAGEPQLREEAVRVLVAEGHQAHGAKPALVLVHGGRRAEPPARGQVLAEDLHEPAAHLLHVALEHLQLYYATIL